MGKKRSLSQGKGPDKIDDVAEVEIAAVKPKESKVMDFPRGNVKNKSTESAQKVERVEQDDKDDNLFSVPNAKKTKLSKKKTKKQVDASKKVSEKNEEPKEKTKIERFSLKKLSVGTMMMGVITKVLPLALVISLPNMMSGTCDITDISEQYSKYLDPPQTDDIPDEQDFIGLDQLYQSGQYVICAVKELDPDSKTEKLKLTLDPKIINANFSVADLTLGMTIAGSITSHEDHGVQLDLGLGEVKGFIPKSEIDGIDETIPIGKALAAHIVKVSGRVVTLTLDDPSKHKLQTPLSSIDSVLPGMLVDAKVQQVYENGISVLFMGFFQAEIEQYNLAQNPITESKTLAELYPIGKTVRARVVLVSITSLSKTIQLSLRPHIIGMNNIFQALTRFPFGHHISKVEVVKMEARNGLLCKAFVEESEDEKMEDSDEDNDEESDASSEDAEDKDEDDDMEDTEDKDEDDNMEDSEDKNEVSSEEETKAEPEKEIFERIPFFVPFNRVSDEVLETLNVKRGKYKEGTYHAARVMGLFGFEGFIKLSLQPSVVKDDFHITENLTPGQKVTGTIVSVTKGKGVAVKLSPLIPHAFITTMHLADFQIHSLDKRFKVGEKIECKVLSSDPVSRKVYLTCKKTLLTSSLPIISSKEEATPGVISHGVISRILPKGCVVYFWNNISGFVPRSELSETAIEDPSKAFRIGQVIKCTVKNNSENIILSFRSLFEDDLNETSNKEAILAKMESVQPGMVVSGKVISHYKDSILLNIEALGLRAILSHQHLSDHIGASTKKLPQCYKVGQLVDDLVVLSKNLDKGGLTVTKKPLIVTASKLSPESLPSSLKSAKSNDVYVGVISNITTYGVFVKFLGSASALAPKNLISDKFVSSPTDYFELGQTVLSVVNEVSDDKVILSLRISDLEESFKPSHPLYAEALGASLISSFFAESKLCEESDKKKKSSKEKYLPGQYVSAKLKSKMPYGWLLTVGSTEALMTLDHAYKVKAEDGAIINCRVLDFNVDTGILDLTAHPRLMEVETSLESVKSPAAMDSDTFDRLSNQVGHHNSLVAIVELIKEDYMIVSLPNYKSAFAFVSTKLFNDRSSPFLKYKFLQSIKVRLVNVASMEDRVLARVAPGTEKEPKTFVKKDVVHEVNLGDVTTGLFKKHQKGSFKLLVNLPHYKNTGRAHITQVFDSFDKIKDPLNPFDQFRGSRTVKVRVTGLNDATAKSNAAKIGAKSLEISLLPSVVDSKSSGPFKAELGDMSTGDVMVAFVKTITKQGILVLYGEKLTSLITPSHISSNIEIVNKFKKLFTIGSAVEVKVLSVNAQSRDVTFAITNAKIKLPKGVNNYPALHSSIEEYKTGDLVPVQFIKLTSLSHLNSSFTTTLYLPGVENSDMSVQDSHAPYLMASGFITEIVDDYSQLASTLSQESGCIPARVLGRSDDGKSINVSIRGSQTHYTNPQASFSPKNPTFSNLKDLKVSEKVSGFVTFINDQGIEISISKAIKAKVSQETLVTNYGSDWASEILKGDLIEAVIEKVNIKAKSIELGSLSKPLHTFNEISELSDWDQVNGLLTQADSNGKKVPEKENPIKVKIGQEFECTVVRVNPASIYVSTPANVKGMIHINQMSKNFKPKDLNMYFEKDDTIKATVSRIDQTKETLHLKILPKNIPEIKTNYVDEVMEDSDEDELPFVESDEEETEEESEAEVEPLDIEEDAESEPDSEQEDDDDMDVSDLEAEVEEESKAQQSHKKKAKNSLPADLTGEQRAPEVASDYEKLLLASPNSSYLWINFMAYHLQLSAIEKAREVGKKALGTINLREEQERFNIHVALLNLEFKFGDATSLNKQFQESKVMVNKPKQLYYQLARIYRDGDKIEEADFTYQIMSKKFAQSSKVWSTMGEFYLSQKKVDQARAALQRSLKVLPKRKHLKTITKFAQLEYKLGDAERARTLFEGIVANYPKRLDLWSVYMDMEIKLNENLESVRRLFNRALDIKWSSKKAKFLFKKFLQFEKENGEPQHIDHVKGLALAYVQSLNQ